MNGYQTVAAPTSVPTLDALAFEQYKFFMHPPYNYTRDVAMVYSWCLRMTMLEGYLQSPSPSVE